MFTQVNTDRARLVRPYDDGFQVVAGHHRLAAARAAGLDAMPCWVEEMDDEAAFLELVRSNRQSELTPLERGMHALKSGLTVRAYADEMGMKLGTVQNLMEAAKVARAR